jgi:hypothetical protein
VKEIGFARILEYAIYQVQLKSEWIEKRTPPFGIPSEQIPKIDTSAFLSFPILSIEKIVAQIDFKTDIFRKADDIVNGYYHPFGGELQPLKFIQPQGALKHWTKYSDLVEGLDIKDLWEPARFSWALDLARAYLLIGDERYVETFWNRFEEFVRLNPINLGPTWVSAQECGIRIIMWTLVLPIIKNSKHSSEKRLTELKNAIWQHAARIPPTLLYARSQNNNHLLSESLGLIIAGSVFSKKSQAVRKWLRLGVSEFNSAIIHQIEPDGTYSQHSANYHRLMLQLSLLYFAYAKYSGVTIPKIVFSQLASAAQWLTAQVDSKSGRLPNLGHNDGSFLLPMGCKDFSDFRPTAQAASIAFLGKPCLPAGSWNELSTWLGFESYDTTNKIDPPHSSAVHKVSTRNSWATLRGVYFRGRPAHADQLHVDLWWDGFNIAQDAGTYSYNANPPWNNSLSSTLVHNTIYVDEEDQMIRAGKFLWLQRAQATWHPSSNQDRLTASHDGYLKKGILLTRSIEFPAENVFDVHDHIDIEPVEMDHLITIHWLLPDWSYKKLGKTLLLEDKNHRIELFIFGIFTKTQNTILPVDISLIRAGVSLSGNRTSPVLGWASPTYGLLKPALSYSLTFQSNSSIQIRSKWKFLSSKLFWDN